MCLALLLLFVDTTIIRFGSRRQGRCVPLPVNSYLTLNQKERKKKKKTETAISEFRSKQIFFHICLNPMPESSERDRPKLPKVKANLFPHYLSFIFYHPSLLTSDL